MADDGMMADCWRNVGGNLAHGDPHTGVSAYMSVHAYSSVRAYPSAHTRARIPYSQMNPFPACRQLSSSPDLTSPPLTFTTLCLPQLPPTASAPSVPDDSPPCAPLVSIVPPSSSQLSSRRIRNLADQDQALRAAINPYDDGPGELYITLRLTPRLLAPYRAGSLSAADLSPLLNPQNFQLKIGHTNDVRRRRPEYRRCAEGQFLHWHAYFPVPKRKLAERLAHLRLKAVGARLRSRRCPGPRCRTRHREYFSLTAAGGLHGVEAIVQGVVVDVGGVYQRFPFL
ncbi:hypothetical protein C8R44DRAFT_738702 [Mycena epipterygia]|nr:hypothetical protein C8R44DRAFT_738702 [Mycena epipterygia]